MLVVLTSVPAAIPTTVSENAQEEPPAIAAPDRAIELEPAVAVIVPPPHDPFRPLGVATRKPAGSVSTKAIWFNPTVVFGTDTVKDNDVVPPTGIEAIANDFDSDGAAANAGAASTRNTPTPTTLPRNHNPRTTRRDRRHRTLRAHITTDRCTPRKRTCSATTSAPAPAPAARSSCAIRRACRRGPGDRFRDPRCTRRTIPLATHRSPASRSVPAIAPQRTGSASPPLVGPLGFARRREEMSLWRRAGAPPSGTRDPLRCHHGPSRWSADESSSAPHERISGRASRPSSRVSSKVPWRASRNRDSATPRGLLLAWDRVAPRRLWRRRHTPAASGRQPWPGLMRRRRRVGGVTYFSSNKRRSEGSRSRSSRMMFPSVL